MSALADLEAAIAAAPDDDEPRLVWADAVGGERGELVVIQCRLAREDLPAAERELFVHRTTDLLAAYGAMWSGFAGERAVKRCRFRRGFVDAVEANVVEMPWARVFEIAPLVTAFDVRGITQIVDHRARITGAHVDPVEFLAAMFAQPEFERLRGIGIDDAALYEVLGDDEWSNEYTSRGDEVLAMIAASDALVGIKSLAIHDRVTGAGIDALQRSKALPSIERLRLGDASVVDADLFGLFAAMPSLRALDLKVPMPLREYHWTLPASLVELRVHGEDDAPIVQALRCFTNLERLAANAFPATAPPRLRSFELVDQDQDQQVAKPLVHVGTYPREPWGNYGVVALHR